MHYARIYDPQLTAGGGLSFEAVKGQETPPNTAPTGPRTEFQTAADLEQALNEAEARVANDLDLLRIAKHFRANNGLVNASLISRINTDPQPNATLDMTGSIGVINP